MSSKPVPIVRAHDVEGISQVDGSEMYYGSWHLLNEAISCFRNHEYYACLCCLSTSTELWLRREMKASSGMNLQRLIATARKSGVITEEESKDLNSLRKTRNSYVHFDMDKLPKVKHMHEIGKYESGMTLDTFVESAQNQNTLNPYPTEGHKDLIPLFMLGPTAHIILNKVVAFFFRRYPNSDAHINIYWTSIVEQIGDTTEKDCFVSLKPMDVQDSWRTRLSRFFMK